MQKIAVLPLLAFLGICTTSERASACDQVEPIHQYLTSNETNDSTPPVLLAADISIMRAEHPGNRGGSCEDIGSYVIEVDASDNMTAAVDLGFALNLVDGNFPFAVPKGNVTGISNDGNFETWFVDEGGAFDGTLEVQVVDRAGNVSEAIELSASGDEVGSCTCSSMGMIPVKHAWVPPLILLTLMLRRRARRVAALGIRQIGREFGKDETAHWGLRKCAARDCPIPVVHDSNARYPTPWPSA